MPRLSAGGEVRMSHSRSCESAATTPGAGGNHAIQDVCVYDSMTPGYIVEPDADGLEKRATMETTGRLSRPCLRVVYHAGSNKPN